jgi:hypothetical protein
MEVVRTCYTRPPRYLRSFSFLCLEHTYAGFDRCMHGTKHVLATIDYEASCARCSHTFSARQAPTDRSMWRSGYIVSVSCRLAVDHVLWCQIHSIGAGYNWISLAICTDYMTQRRQHVRRFHAATQPSPPGPSILHMFWSIWIDPRIDCWWRFGLLG